MVKHGYQVLLLVCKLHFTLKNYFKYLSQAQEKDMRLNLVQRGFTIHVVETKRCVELEKILLLHQVNSLLFLVDPVHLHTLKIQLL